MNQEMEKKDFAGKKKKSVDQSYTSFWFTVRFDQRKLLPSKKMLLC